MKRRTTRTGNGRGVGRSARERDEIAGLKGRVLEVIDSSSSAPTIPDVVTRMLAKGVGERPTRVVVQHLVERGPLWLDSRMTLKREAQ